MIVSTNWRDYEIIDAGDGEKLERWGEVVLRRPDPQAIWPRQSPELWSRADAEYRRSERGGGEWTFHRKLPERWVIGYRDLKFYVRPTGFKHTGLFPEQADNWDWMRSLIGRRPGARILNLFGYTGGATIACGAAGAQVTHVDAAKGMAQWAGENRKLCGIPEQSVRWIIDDALKFVSRERRRGARYDGILMDPPSFGRGPGGEVWKLEDALFGLVDQCAALLGERPLFLLVNSYTTGLQPAVLHNIIRMTAGKRRAGHVIADELALPVTSGGVLPCGACGRFEGEG